VDKAGVMATGLEGTTLSKSELAEVQYRNKKRFLEDFLKKGGAFPSRTQRNPRKAVSLRRN